MLTSFFKVEILRPCRRPRLGRIPPKVELTPRVLLLPLLMSEPVRMFFAAAEAQTYRRRVAKLHFFSPCFEY
jgi:hypothetical protein